MIYEKYESIKDSIGNFLLKLQPLFSKGCERVIAKITKYLFDVPYDVISKFKEKHENFVSSAQTYCYKLYLLLALVYIVIIFTPGTVPFITPISNVFSKYVFPLIILSFVFFFDEILYLLLKAITTILVASLFLLNVCLSIIIPIIYFVISVALFILLSPLLYLELLIKVPGKLFLSIKSLRVPLKKRKYIALVNGIYYHLGSLFIFFGLLICLAFIFNINISPTSLTYKYMLILFILLTLAPILPLPGIVISRLLEINMLGKLKVIAVIILTPVAWFYFHKNPIVIAVGFLFLDYYLLRRE